MSLRILIFLLFNSVVFCSCNISAAKSNKFINSVYQLTNLKFFLNQLGKSFEKQEKDWPDLRQTFRFLRPHTSLRYRGILEGPKTIRKYANLLSHNERKYTGSVESFDILRPPSNYSVFGVSNSCQHDMSVGVLNGFKLLMMLLDEERVLEMVGTSLRPVIEGLKDLKKLEEETVQAIITTMDAFFKIPTGILGGNLHWVGSWALCNSMKNPYTDWVMEFRQNSSNITYKGSRSFGGKYCRIAWVPTEDLLNGSALIPLEVGLCFPDSCNFTEIGSIIQNGLELSTVYDFETKTSPRLKSMNELLGLSVLQSFCGNSWYSASDFWQGRAVLWTILVILIIVIVSTIYDIVFRKKFLKLRVHYLESLSNRKADATYYLDLSNESKSFEIEEDFFPENQIGIRDRLERIIAGCSAYSNSKEIFNTSYKRGYIPTLNALKFLSFGWAVVGNTYVFGILVAEVHTTGNLINALPKLLKRWTFQPVLNYHFNMDSFLTISGFLVAYSFINRYKSIKEITPKVIALFYFHRWWQLVPPLMIILGLFAYFYKQLGDGPLFGITVTDAENCKSSWWTVLLLLHNVLKKDSRCLAWTIYAGLLWQLHLITPFIIIPFLRKPAAGFISLAVFYLAHIIATAIISSREYGGGLNVGGFFSEILTAPWCRAGPYLIGMGFAFVYQHKHKLAAKINGYIAIVLWVVSIAIITSITFSSISLFDQKDKLVDPWKKPKLVAFDTLSRSAFSIAIVWIIFACTSGYGGFLTRFFRWRAFVPLSKILYPAMLIHTVVIFRYIYNKRIPILVEDFEMIYLFFGHTFGSYGVGILVALFFWYPFLNLEKAVLLMDKKDLFMDMKKYIKSPRK